MRKISIDGKEYPVVENLGYSHDRGCYAVVVTDGDSERISISYAAKLPWRWARPIVAPSGPVVGQAGGDER